MTSSPPNKQLLSNSSHLYINQHDYNLIKVGQPGANTILSPTQVSPPAQILSPPQQIRTIKFTRWGWHQTWYGTFNVSTLIILTPFFPFYTKCIYITTTTTIPEVLDSTKKRNLTNIGPSSCAPAHSVSSKALSVPRRILYYIYLH